MLGMAMSLSGCGGHKILKEARPMVTTQQLVSANDAQLVASLDWVIFRDGPGTWVRNADWDQYLMTFTNNSDDVLEIRNATVYDSLAVPADTQTSRKLLIRGSKQTAKRYRDEGLKVKAGVGGTALVVAGTATGAVAVSAGMVVVYGGAAASTAVAAGLLLGPALIVGGVMKGVNGQKVAKEIDVRQVDLPLRLQPGETQYVNLFFPLSPSPQRVEISYRAHQTDQLLSVDTKTALSGLHINSGDE